MKRICAPQVLFAGLLALTPLAAKADVFFNDTFGNGSTINSTNPAASTVSSTSYQQISGKNWDPDPPSLTNNDLKFGIESTTGGTTEIQALFGTNTVTLVQVGDTVQLIVTFTNTAGLLTANGGLSFGLYDSGGVQPVAGGMYATCRSSYTDQATGGVQNWQGYVAQIGYTNSYSSRIMTREMQTGTDNRNQELVTSGSSTYSYRNPAYTAVGSSSTTPSVALTTNQVYTDVLTIILTNENTLAITNTLYIGTDTNSTPLTQFGGVASGSTYLTSGFNGLAVGWYEKGGEATTMDISSIMVAGHYTKVTRPPDIVTEPSDVTVPNGGTCAFFVTAQGYNMSYQWHRGGTNLVDGGNISGANSDTLVVSPASAADVASGANGYYVTITGANGYTTNSTKASLSLGTAKNLTWAGPGDTWDLNTSANWKDSGGNSSVFNFGDNVTFNGGTPTGITLDGRYLSASSVTVEGGTGYSFSGSGSIAGPGTLNFSGSFLDIVNANTFTGGTIMTNGAGEIYLEDYNGLGTGPVTFATPGAILELPNTGSASSGIPGDINVADDGIIAYDATNSSYAVVLFGNLEGTAGKQLSIQRYSGGSDTCRIRLYGNNTMYDGNLELADASTLWATYESSGTQAYNGVISGSGAIMIKGKTTYLNGPNTYSGGTYAVTGSLGLGNDSALGTGPLLLTVDSTTSTTAKGEIFASGGAHTIANPIQYPSGSNNLTLVVSGSNDLTLSGPITLNGADGGTVYTNRIFQVDNTAMTIFSGVISDGGMGFGITKNGTGTLALNNSESYSGPTIVGAGSLLVNGQLPSSSPVTVQSGGSLGGSGTIGGPVTVETDGTLAPGNSNTVTTLTADNNLTLNGNVLVDINKSLSPASSNDMVSVSGTLNSSGTGTLTVDNLGPALVAGDRFQVFNKALSGGGTITVTGASAVWNNNLATDGSISVASVIVPKPVVTTTTLLGGNAGLVMSGTNGTEGNAYYVLSSTNLATPVTNWTLVSTNYFGPGGVFSVTNPVSAGVPQTFYLLQLP